MLPQQTLIGEHFDSPHRLSEDVLTHHSYWKDVRGPRLATLIDQSSLHLPWGDL